METENRQNSKARKVFLFAVIPLCSAFMIYYLVMMLVSPANQITSVNNEFAVKTLENVQVNDTIFYDSVFVKLNREKAYFQARTIMAETDSICLTLNLADSSAIVEIAGVSVHKAKISEIRISKVFRRADENAVTSMLSMPFTIKDSYATIRKEPLMLRVAPKDTSEYKPDIVPDTSAFEPVYYMLQMENGVRLYVFQETGDLKNGKLNRFLFDLNDRFRNLWTAFKSVLVFKVPEYHPYISIQLPATDAKIIYRAIPLHGQIAVFR